MTTTTSPTTPRARDAEFWLVGTSLACSLIAVAAVAAWPIYADAAYLLLVTVAVALAAGIALLATLRRWRPVVVVAVVLGSYLVVGVPLAVPDALRSFDAIPGGLLDLVTGPVTGWKQIVTIVIPVGSYQATAVPALVVFLVGGLLVFLSVWRPDRRMLFVIPVALLMQAFGLLFGASSVSPALRLASLVIPAPREVGLSMIALVLLVVLLIWRASWERRQALYRAREASGIRNVSSHRPAALRRSLVAVGMLLVAGTLAALVITPALSNSAREVLRTSVEPELRIRDDVSPLSTYRAAFEEGSYGETLFRVETVTGPAADRLRLATLAFYDGAVFRVADPAAAPGTATDFRRVPAKLPGEVSGEHASLRVEVAALGGFWMPLPPSPVRVDFDGPRRSELVDGFYHSRELESAIELARGGLTSGDRIVVDHVIADAVDITELAPLAPEARTATAQIPEELMEWVREQDASLDGAGLQLLVERLRARGYLSHSLQEPLAADTWTTRLASYSFAPSRAGHSADRIGRMFAALLEREEEIGASGESGLGDAAYVAAVGDDEQFATAAALIARHLGFDSRVVLGFRMNDDSGIVEPAPCLGGECRGANLTAWAEVRGADGRWAVLDATPQFSSPLSPSLSTVRDPKLPTELASQVADSRLPPEAAPADGETGADAETDDERADLTWLWSILRATGTVLLVSALVLAPFLTVLGAKAVRRSRRRRAGDAESRIAGGWLEWVDTAIDHGVRVPSNATRTEIAARLARHRPDDDTGGGVAAVQIADWADRAVFSAVPPSEEEGELFWQLVDAERKSWRAGRSFGQRVRSALSLASFTRTVDARALVPDRAQQIVRRWSPTRVATSTRFPKGVTRSRRMARP